MGILLSFTFSLVLLVVLWALNVKALDATLLMMLIMTVAIGAHVIRPHLPGRRDSGA